MNIYNELAKFVVEKSEEESDKEEILAREEFRKFHIVKINLSSVTIDIPTSHIKGWNYVLNEEIGLHKDQTETSNGYWDKTQEGINVKSMGKSKGNLQHNAC